MMIKENSYWHRFPLILVAGISLLVGLWAGIARMGWPAAICLKIMTGTPPCPDRPYAMPRRAMVVGTWNRSLVMTRSTTPELRSPLSRITAIYAIETEIRGRDARRDARQLSTKPLIAELRTWLDVKLATVSGKSTIAEAIRYGTSRWPGLTRFIEDGRLEADNNIAENAIRSIAMRLSLCTLSSSI